MIDGGRRVALVTGGNRGIGLEICRQLAARGYGVLLASRDRARGEAAAALLRSEAGIDAGAVEAVALDTTDPEAGAALRAIVEAGGGRLDALVNNAAILIDERRSILEADLDEVRLTMETNVYGPLRLCQAAIPLMQAAGFGRIVNVTSEMGQLNGMGPRTPAYRLSKTALNAVTAMLAAATRGEDILVNACCPGWVRTEMGGPSAPRAPAEGADTPVWLATLPPGGPSGGFFQDRKRIPW